MYHARVCDFEADLTAAEGEILSIGTGTFDRRNVDPVRLTRGETSNHTIERRELGG